MGSNNIQQISEDKLSFEVVIQRDRPLAHWALQDIKNEHFTLHYEVEGPCVSNDV